MPIKILDNKTISQIAAGEVVERPASVVKELVENSLDAGATQITVEAKGGGVSLLRITDNGSGIPSAELELAFERHATSKITSPGDLQTIGTLGFRGEALPSIAAVAGVEVLTCAGDEAGTYLGLEGGVIITGSRSQARPHGTTITVSNLFGNVPARLKFLKTASTENGHIANIVSQYALAYPEVAFTLIIEGKESLRTSGRGKLIDSIVDVYGVAIAGGMLPLEEPGNGYSGGGESGIRVGGMVGSPQLSRSGRGYLSFFVNRRWVTSRLLSWATEEAYHGLLMTGKHPVAVLNITLPPDEIDINIHPAKSEVKFQRERDVFRAIQRAIRQTLVGQMPVPEIGEIADSYVAGKVSRPELWPHAIPTGGKNPQMPQLQPTLSAALPVLRVVGQVLGCYIVAEGPGGVYLIDQHAAHERIRFDKVREEMARKSVEVQGLLEPVTLEITPRQEETLKACYGELGEYGFSLEPFGPKTYLVRAVPAMMAGEGWEAALREMLDSLSGTGGGDREEKIIASIACHGAIRSGQKLTIEEMRELARQLEQTANPHTCPHGRPTMIHLSAGQLEKEFGRS